MNHITNGLCIALCLAVLSLAAPAMAEGRTVPVAESAAAGKVHPRMKTYMKRRWGVEVLWVKQTAAGHMLEFRYKVLDAEKAKPLFDRQTKPVLIHQKSGSQLIVPTPGKTGALRNSNTPREGTTYWMFFANPGKLVRPGDQVTIQIGEYLQQHVTVAADH